MNQGSSEIRRPKPKIEPPDPAPGGATAVPTAGGSGIFSRVGRDPNPDHNPETDEIPAAAKEPDDTDTEATKGGEEEPSESEPSG
ncbi:MAG TPA: hypothetical protein VNS55_15325 [Nocardioides sp.]|nr:hypothetical protein [Nocardioides sp.]